MKHNVLISAFSCSPLKGSEPGVGWRWAIEMAKTQNVYLLTRTKCKENIEKFIPQELKDNIKCIYVDSSFKLRKITIYLEYIHWQRKAYKYLKNNYDVSFFDYSIHLTFGNIFLPYWIYKLDIPHICGPVGGADVIPFHFLEEFSFREKVRELIKYMLLIFLRINPIIKRISKKSIAILVRTEETKKCISKKYYYKTYSKLETVMNEQDTKDILDVNNNFFKILGKSNNIKIITTGKLVGSKNTIMVIRAMKKILEKRKDVELHIVGEGHLKEKLEKLCIKYNIVDKVFFYGNLTREKTLQLVSQSDIFAFPSLKEGGSWSLMEAMLFKKPVVCLNCSGMKVIMNKKCGYLVEPTNIKKTTLDFSECLLNLIEDEELRANMGKEAYQRIINCFSTDSLKKYVEHFFDELDKISLKGETYEKIDIS